MKKSDIFFDGLEIGAVSLKWVRRTIDGITDFKIIVHEGKIKEKCEELFKQVYNKINAKVIVTGQTAKNLLNLPYHSEIECLEKSLSFHNIKPDLLVSLGGEAFTVYPMKDGLIKNIISTSKCAAGTGEFIVQQFQRMGMTLEQGLKASVEGKKVQLATRCSVHCKSDATHKLNRGECFPQDIAKSLISDLAKKVSDMVNLTKWDTGSIAICGGVSLNKIFLDEFKNHFEKADIRILPESHYLEAFGASLYAEELSSKISSFSSAKWFKKQSKKFTELKPLKYGMDLLDYRVRENFDSMKLKPTGEYILGVDAGSTTTKAVLLDISNNELGASCYLRTEGNPVSAVKKCLEQLELQCVGRNINIVQIGVTGSAREMVSVYLDNCSCFNEILAHGRGAVEYAPEVDTVFEIGGQDSKFISFLNGVPVDYSMNEGCSAGTGSFIEESAKGDLKIPVDRISQVALESRHPIAFGERCAAFINTDLRNAFQQGVSHKDIIAGLVYSIAENYVLRIVGPRHIGKSILFLGGVALNKAVALALAIRIQRKIIVPPYPELMGSVGVALMVKDLILEHRLVNKIYKLSDLKQGDMEIKGTFRCASCENNCEIKNILIRDENYPFGGVCSKYEMIRTKSKARKEGKDLISLRNEIMFNQFGPENIENALGNIGLPMTLSTLEFFPFYVKLINELGYNVVFSKPSKIGNSKTNAPICYPCELMHGAVYDLINRNLDYIFLPYLIEVKVKVNIPHSYFCTSTAVMPDLIRSAFKSESAKILSPHIWFSETGFQTNFSHIDKISVHLNISEEDALNATMKAWEYYKQFKAEYITQGKRELEKIYGEPTVVIAGRPYVICDSEVNLAVPKKIISKGYHAVPFDIFPEEDSCTKERNEWYYTQQISQAIKYVKGNRKNYLCFISCYSCGPDACMYHFFKHELKDRVFCYLEIDSHTAHAGFDTRLGAFLEIIEQSIQKENEKAEPIVDQNEILDKI